MLDPDEPYDLIHDQVPRISSGDDEPIQSLLKTIKFPNQSHSEAVCFSPDGSFFVIGTVDGFIEVYNYMTGKLRRDLKYQADDNMMITDSAVLCLSFDQTSTSLASGGQNGSIYIWNVHSGALVKSVGNAHTQGITSLCFTNDGTQILSSSFDQTVKVHGLKSGRVLKVFRGHSSFVNVAVFSKDESAVISGSSDGTVKIWNYSTTDCISTISLTDGRSITKAVNLRSVHSILSMKDPDIFLVSNHSHFLYVINLRGKLLKAMEVKGEKDINGVALSCKNEFIYVTTEKEIFCLSRDTNDIVCSTQVCRDGEVIGVRTHPFANLLSVYTDNGAVKIFGSDF